MEFYREVNLNFDKERFFSVNVLVLSSFFLLLYVSLFTRV